MDATISQNSGKTFPVLRTSIRDGRYISEPERKVLRDMGLKLAKFSSVNEKGEVLVEPYPECRTTELIATGIILTPAW